MSSRNVLLTTAVVGLILAATSEASARQVTPDIVYATVDGKDLALDLYMPEGVASPPLVVWVHGGAWRAGTKASGVPTQFVDAGYAVASLDFRQSTDAPFPAMIHDIKAGVRFLRAEAKAYGYDASRIAIAGASSGGHLAALVGVTNGQPELEGTVGHHPEASSDIQAILDYFGPTNLETILPQSTPHGLSVRQPALDLLLGGQPEAVAELARLASPVDHVDRNDPPLLIFHGDQDPQVPINQSHELQGAYEALGLDVHFDVVHGAGHGGPAFYEPAHLDRALEFLGRVIGR